jgi:hypothetical protein
MTTVAHPLSAGKMVMSGIFQRSVMVRASSGVMLEGDVLGWLRMWGDCGAEIVGSCRVGADGDGCTFGGCDEVNGRGVARCGAEGETFGEDVDLGLGKGDG